MNLIAVLALAAAELNGQPLPDVVLLDFTASYCPPCQQMVPVLQRMERDGFPIRKVDIGDHPDLSRQYRVDRLPTLILLVEGQEVERFVGLTAEARLRRQMNDAARKLDVSRRAAGAKESTPVVDANQQPPQVVKNGEPQERPGLLDRMRQGLFGKPAEKENPVRPDFRGQSPDRATHASTTTNDSMSMKATVRVRLDDGEFRDVGTGTIVHSTSGQSTILTCAHIFKEVGADAAVSVEFFRDGETLKYPATVVGGDHDADIAFIQIQNKAALPSTPLARLVPKAETSVFSIGCNGGNLPTVMTTKIVQLNRYEGPENVVCEIAPVQGRSGGGLFNSAGELIGVCSGAFRERKEGLYTGLGAVRKLATQLSLKSLFEEEQPLFTAKADDAADSVSDARNPFEDDGDVFDEVFNEVAGELDGSIVADESGSGAPTPAKTLTSNEQLPDPFAPTPRMANVSAAPQTEITVIIKSKGSAGEKRVVIPRPSPWLLEMLTGESAGGKAGLAVARSKEISATSSRSAER